MFHKVSANDKFNAYKGENFDFLSRTCCFRVRKVFVVQLFNLSIKSGMENFFA